MNNCRQRQSGYCNMENPIPQVNQMRNLSAEKNEEYALNKTAEKMMDFNKGNSWDKQMNQSEYDQRKNQLYQRLWVENEEKKLEECLFRANQSNQAKASIKSQLEQEEKYAQALKEIKEEELQSSILQKQEIMTSPEIIELERQLNNAYYAKTLFAQRNETEAKKLEEKLYNLECHNLLMEKLLNYDTAEERRVEKKLKQQDEYKRALINQMKDGSSRKVDEKNETVHDKELVDEIIEKIKREEIESMQERAEKVNSYKTEIYKTLEDREKLRRAEEERKLEEDKKIKEFIKQKDFQKEAFEQAKAEREAIKEKMLSRTINQIVQQKYQNDELDELRRELSEHLMEEKYRKRDEEEIEKKYKIMRELQNASMESKRLRNEKLKLEQIEEENFKKELMNSFAEDQRIIQLTKDKRRQKEIEYKNKVEGMIIERRAIIANQREKQLEDRNSFVQETEKRKIIIEEKRIQLLKEHGIKLLGFMPKGVIRSEEELLKLGEPFISFYKNQQFCFEGCEEINKLEELKIRH